MKKHCTLLLIFISIYQLTFSQLNNYLWLEEIDSEQSLLYIDSLNKKDYQGIKDLKTLDTIIMFCPNEKALELPDKGGQKLMEYALSKKVTLCGPSMLFLILKVAEYLTLLSFSNAGVVFIGS